MIHSLSMRYVTLYVSLLALCAPGPAAAGTVVSAFYYPWFETTSHDGEFAHWAQGGHAPPMDIASNYYSATGVYSSSSTEVLDAQMADVARAGIDELAVSWWGRGSAEDARLPAVLAAAERHGIAVAAHLEPYAGRTVASTVADIAYLQGLGVRTFYVYRPFDLPAAEWAPANDQLRLQGLEVWAQTALVGAAVTGHFSGVYTYDTLVYNGRLFARLCRQAHSHGLLCAPSVGPGYDADRATGDTRVKPRRDGLTYDSMWRAAIRAGADRITITSFNEWQEGTQIEPAASIAPVGAYGYSYASYDGAWGLRGVSAETAYLERTAQWARLFRTPERSMRLAIPP
jgi:glycoprotein endo-alpha-1,2-mannosidase